METSKSRLGFYFKFRIIHVVPSRVKMEELVCQHNMENHFRTSVCVLKNFSATTAKVSKSCKINWLISLYCRMSSFQPFKWYSCRNKHRKWQFSSFYPCIFWSRTLQRFTYSLRRIQLHTSHSCKDTTFFFCRFRCRLFLRGREVVFVGLWSTAVPWDLEENQSL